MEQHSSNEDNNKQVQELLPSRLVIQPNETIIIDDDDDDVTDGRCPDVSASVSKPPDHIKVADEPSGKSDLEVTNQDHNNVPNKQIHITDKVAKRRRPRPPDLPKKKQHKIIRIPLPKSSISHATVKSFKPTISLQKLFAGTSPRLVVKDNELQPAVALTEQYNILPRQHPVHNWTIGIKRHKFRIYTK